MFGQTLLMKMPTWPYFGKKKIKNVLMNNLFSISYKNGSLTRERIRDSCANGDWQIFNELINSTTRGNFGNIGLSNVMYIMFTIFTRNVL